MMSVSDRILNNTRDRHSRVHLVFGGVRTHTEDTVLTLQPNLDTWREELHLASQYQASPIHKLILTSGTKVGMPIPRLT